MPIYEYRCQDCGEKVEILLRSGGKTPRCPNCESPRLEKLISVPYLITAGHFPGPTCCGREERCAAPPCSPNGECRRG